MKNNETKKQRHKNITTTKYVCIMSLSIMFKRHISTKGITLQEKNTKIKISESFKNQHMTT